MIRSFLIVVTLFLTFSTARAQQTPEGSLAASSSSGTVLGVCPLKHTSVRTDISGFMARVTVVQEFENPFTETISAEYVFPLSQNSAVDSMTMTIGTRTIRGSMMKREEARKVFEKAQRDGKTASLLDQERPNVFTQSVANILPGEKIVVEISYAETLAYEDGSYEFVFPMTIAPRYSPGGGTSSTVAPVYAETRAGHDISIEINLDAGVPVESIRSTTHEIDTLTLGVAGGKITLRDQNTIPNKDFILRYDVTGKKLEDAVLTHNGPNGGFFSMILQPPDEPRVEDVTPKEIVFVLDTSGSMSGFPIEKAKEAIRLTFDGLYPHDTFNLVTFAGDTRVLFEQPVPATRANLDTAIDFLESRSGAGGTEMMTAIRTALAPSGSQDHIRIVCFMTDGLVDNEAEIIAEVRKQKNARVFSFGIGSSTNRYLLDKIAEAGRGEAEYVGLDDDGSKAARRFYERVRTPLLTDISINWNGLPVSGVYPRRIGDLFSAKPVVVYGKFSAPGKGKAVLRGKLGGRDCVREIEVDLPASKAENAVLGTLWARTRIDDLIAAGTTKDESEDEPQLRISPAARAEITSIGLRFGIMTEFTSFVAVDEIVRTDGRKTKKVLVPSEIGDGIDPEMGTGGRIGGLTNPKRLTNVVLNGRGLGRGQGNGSGNGLGNGSGGNGDSNGPVGPRPVSGGVVNGRSFKLVKPEYPAAARTVRASGTVQVEVLINESGAVEKATAISGHPLLRAAAVNAALKSTFSPTLINAEPTKVRTVITYNFASGDINPAPISATKKMTAEELDAIVRQAEIRADESRRAIAEFEARLRVTQKLHFWVFDLFERVKKKEPIAGNDPKFVREGKASLEVGVSDLSRQTLERLRAIGFVIESTGPLAAKNPVISGEIAVENLTQLVDLNEVKLIIPRIR